MTREKVKAPHDESLELMRLMKEFNDKHSEKLKMNSPLKVGDRVRVYGWVQMHHQPYIARAGGKATVVWVGGKNNKPQVKFDSTVSGHSDDLVHYPVDPKQCRRLICKPKPKPKSVKVTREMLQSAWNAKVPTEASKFKQHYFEAFCKELGL